MKKRVLVFCEYYRPGFKGGGGMWTVANLIDRLGDRFEFGIVCRNHDGAGDRAPYPDVPISEWIDLGGHSALYVEPASFSKISAARIVDEFEPDAIFINSVFGLTTRMPLEARRKGWIDDVPIIIAPCGELSESCLAIKSLKKTAFLKYSEMFGLYAGVVWKATSEAEAGEIRARFGDNVTIEIAPDLLPASLLPEFDFSEKPVKQPGRVRLITVARVAPKKNLEYLLHRLADCRRGGYELEIVGGVDDRDYWRSCEALIAALPANVRVRYLGALTYEAVLERLVHNHFFVLPTLNENFGYVFVEAMAAGCPLLISENTIWWRVENAGGGWVLPLNSADKWKKALEQCAAVGPDSYEVMSKAARRFAMDWLGTSGDEAANRRIIEKAVDRDCSSKSNVERAK